MEVLQEVAFVNGQLGFRLEPTSPPPPNSQKAIYNLMNKQAYWHKILCTFSGLARGPYMGKDLDSLKSLLIVLFSMQQTIVSVGLILLQILPILLLPQQPLSLLVLLLLPAAGASTTKLLRNY